MVQTPRGFLRFSGVMMMLSSVIGAAVMIIHVEDTPAGLQDLGQFLTTAVWSHVALFMAIAMMLIGLPGLYLRQSEGLKWWGWLSFVLLFFSFFLDACHAVLQIFDYPVLFGGIDNEAQLKEASEFVMNVQMGMPGNFFMAISGPMLLLGTLLMGIAFLKAKAISRGPAIATLVLFAGIIGMFFAPEWYVIALLSCYYLSFAWYGAILAFEKNKPASAVNTKAAA